MSSARLIARLLGVALLVGGMLGMSAWPGPRVFAEWTVGDSEIPAEKEVEKMTTEGPALPVLVVGIASYAADHAVAESAPRGAPPTPPPEV